MLLKSTDIYYLMCAYFCYFNAGNYVYVKKLENYEYIWQKFAYLP